MGGGLFGCLQKVVHKREFLSLIKLINFRLLLAGVCLARKKKTKKNTNHVDRFDYGEQLGHVARTETTSVQKLLGYICCEDGYDLSMKEMASPKSHLMSSQSVVVLVIGFHLEKSPQRTFRKPRPFNKRKKYLEAE